MSTLNWPGFGLASISPTLDQPSQSNSSAWTGSRTVITNPWHGKWSFKVTLATRQGDAAFQAARAFFTSLKGQINTFHLPAVEAPQNANTGVTLSANAAQGATSIALTGVTTALVAGNMVTIAGQLLSLTTVGSLSGSAQTVNFMPTLRAAASSGVAVETAKPYALVYSDSSFTWDIGQWRRYGLSFNATEAVGETDGADPALDVWTGGTGGSGGGGSSFSFPQLASFTTRSLLAAVTSPADKQVAYLTEAGREGAFVFSTANLSASVTADPHQGAVVAPAADTTGASGAWRRRGTATVGPSPPVIPQQFYEATDPDAQNMVQGAIDYLHTFALNTGGGGFYKGGPKLLVPAGLYDLHAALENNHSLIMEGEGCGFIYSGGQQAKLRWTAGSNGIHDNAANTSGNTTIDGSTHDGGFLWLRDIYLEGGFSGTEGDFHGLVLRSGAKLSNVYIYNWQGAGIRGWTGTVSGQGSFSGNISLNRFDSVTCEGNREGFDFRGTDSNVLTFVNCNSYQNRLAGVIDDNGAGSNTYLGHHAASNGGITGAWAQTQCSYSGNRYAAAWGGDPTIAPSGTTADTANWLYIEAGGAVAGVIPAWVSTANTFRAGGDYVTINTASVVLYDCYAEYGGFSQFNATTRIDEGTIGSQYYRGGTRTNSGTDGFHVRHGPNNSFVLEHRSTEGDFIVQDEAGVQHSLISFGKTGGNIHKARDVFGHIFQTAPYNGVSTTRASITVNGLELPSAHVVTVNGVQVLTGRRTGWAADTGTAKRTANASYGAGTTLTFSATYVQSELTALATRLAAVETALQNTSQAQKAVKDDLITHGIIGP